MKVKLLYFNINSRHLKLHLTTAVDIKINYFYSFTEKYLSF